MPALPVFIAADADRVAAHLVKHCGYTSSMKGYNGVEGGPGSVHWPMESDLPPNMLYHPDRTAKGAYSEATSRLRFDGPQFTNMVAFDVSVQWYGGLSRFDNDKPGKKWENFPKPGDNAM